MTHREVVKVTTKGFCDVRDVTEAVQDAVRASKVREGIVVTAVTGSTAGMTTIEHEPHLLKDFVALMERLAPTRAAYEHAKAWGEDNGFSHLRAALVGPSVTLSIHGGEPELGRWQQVVLVDFDTRPREREVVIRVCGE